MSLFVVRDEGVHVRKGEVATIEVGALRNPNLLVNVFFISFKIKSAKPK